MHKPLFVVGLSAYTVFGVNQGYMDFGKWARDFRVNENHWLETELPPL